MVRRHNQQAWIILLWLLALWYLLEPKSKPKEENKK